MYSREIFSGELLRSVPCCSIIVLMIPSFYILLFARYIDKGRHCLQKGPYFKDLVLNKDLFGILGPYWVLIYISGSLFSLFWLHSRELSHICRHWFRFTLLANFDFYLCLRINFHTSSFWVLFLAAGGPYWVLISQKNGSLLGPYLKAWGSLLVLETVQTCCN